MAAAAVEMKPSQTTAIRFAAAQRMKPVMAAISNPPTQRRISSGSGVSAEAPKCFLSDRLNTLSFAVPSSRIKPSATASHFANLLFGQHRGNRARGCRVANAHLPDGHQGLSLFSCCLLPGECRPR